MADGRADREDILFDCCYYYYFYIELLILFSLRFQTNNERNAAAVSFFFSCTQCQTEGRGGGLGGGRGAAVAPRALVLQSRATRPRRARLVKPRAPSCRHVSADLSRTEDARQDSRVFILRAVVVVPFGGRPSSVVVVSCRPHTDARAHTSSVLEAVRWRARCS